MDINLQKTSTVEGIITIQVTAPDYMPLVDQKLREHSQKSRIKGFRPGHVPISLVKKMYGTSILVETITTLLTDSLTKYLQECNLPLVGEPLPATELTPEIDWNQQQEFEFKYYIGFAEEFELDAIQNLQATAYKIDQVSDKTVELTSQQLAQSYGEEQEVTKSTVGDIVYGELRHAQENFTKKIHFSVESTQGEQSIFENLQIADKITVDIKELQEKGIQPLDIADHVLAELLELGGVFEFVVASIRRTIPAAFDQELFDQVLEPGTVNTQEAFQEALRANIVLQKQQKADQLLPLAIKKLLLEHIAIRLPDDFLKRWLKHSNADLSQEDITKNYQEYAQELRWALIADKIMQAYDLQVTPNEVVSEVKERFKAIAKIPIAHIDQVAQRFLQENKGANYTRIYQELRFFQVIDAIKKQMTIVTQPMSVEELDTLLLKQETL